MRKPYPMGDAEHTVSEQYLAKNLVRQIRATGAAATTWILAGGASLPVQFGVPYGIIDAVIAGEAPVSVYTPYIELALQQWHKRGLYPFVLAVNNGYMLGLDRGKPFAHLVYFGDCSWYAEHREAIERIAATIAVVGSCNWLSMEKRAEGCNIWYARKNREKLTGLSTEDGEVVWGWSSGAAAIDLAVQCGARSVFLFGYDMREHPELGSNHWHMPHRNWTQGKRRPYENYMAGIRQIARECATREPPVKIALVDCERISALRSILPGEILHEGAERWKNMSASVERT